eukprot:2421646-Rhodomonas_salina.4
MFDTYKPPASTKGSCVHPEIEFISQCIHTGVQYLYPGTGGVPTQAVSSAIIYTAMRRAHLKYPAPVPRGDSEECLVLDPVLSDHLGQQNAILDQYREVSAYPGYHGFRSLPGHVYVHKQLAGYEYGYPATRVPEYLYPGTRAPGMEH